MMMLRRGPPVAEIWCKQPKNGYMPYGGPDRLE